MSSVNIRRTNPTGDHHDLDRRITSAFRPETKSAELQALAQDVEGGLRVAVEAAQRARIRALDPELAPAALPEARQRMQDAEFRKQRLEAALPRL